MQIAIGDHRRRRRGRSAQSGGENRATIAVTGISFRERSISQQNTRCRPPHTGLSLELHFEQVESPLCADLGKGIKPYSDLEDPKPKTVAN